MLGEQDMPDRELTRWSVVERVDNARTRAAASRAVYRGGTVAIASYF